MHDYHRHIPCRCPFEILRCNRSRGCGAILLTYSMGRSVGKVVVLAEGDGVVRPVVISKKMLSLVPSSRLPS